MALSCTLILTASTCRSGWHPAVTVHQVHGAPLHRRKLLGPADAVIAMPPAFLLLIVLLLRTAVHFQALWSDVLPFVPC